MRKFKQIQDLLSTFLTYFQVQDIWKSLKILQTLKGEHFENVFFLCFHILKKYKISFKNPKNLKLLKMPIIEIKIFKRS